MPPHTHTHTHTHNSGYHLRQITYSAKNNLLHLGVLLKNITTIINGKKVNKIKVFEQLSTAFIYFILQDFFICFANIFTCNCYILKTLSTNITTDRYKGMFLKNSTYNSVFSIILVQYTQSQSILFTTQNNYLIYINVSFTVTVFHKSLYQTFHMHVFSFRLIHLSII